MKTVKNWQILETVIPLCIAFRPPPLSLSLEAFDYTDKLLSGLTDFDTFATSFNLISVRIT